MKKLIELINIVNKNKVKSIEVIGKPSSKDTLLSKFYNAIHDKKVQSDEDALLLLYGKDADKKAFYKLKHTLKDRLLNTLFLIDIKENKYDDRKQAYLECQKGMAAVNLIIKTDIGRNTVIWLAEKTLKKAIHWRFSEIAVALSSNLCGYHATSSGNRKSFEAYDQIRSDFQELYNAELIVNSKYNDILCYYVNDKSTKTYIYEVADRHLKSIEHLNPKIKSSRFIYQKAMLEIAKYMSINNYEKTLTLCENALEELSNLEHASTKAIVPIRYQMVACCIQLKKYDRGKKQIEAILASQESGSYTWFKAQELFISLLFHTQQYDKAWQTFITVSTNKKFSKLPVHIREVWKIYEAWLYFLFQMDRIQSVDAEKFIAKKFRISRFINEMNVYAKDKKGLNIPILIIHTILLLLHKKHGVLIDRVEAISKYTDRYIKKMENQRSNFFIRMLVEIPKNDFQIKRIKTKTANYLSALKNIPIDVSEQNHDVEILPFEDTWDLIMELIEQKEVQYPNLKRS